MGGLKMQQKNERVPNLASKFNRIFDPIFGYKKLSKIGKIGYYAHFDNFFGPKWGSNVIPFEF